jgi:hypothetical protein
MPSGEPRGTEDQHAGFLFSNQALSSESDGNSPELACLSGELRAHLNPSIVQTVLLNLRRVNIRINGIMKIVSVPEARQWAMHQCYFVEHNIQTLIFFKISPDNKSANKENDIELGDVASYHALK